MEADSEDEDMLSSGSDSPTLSSSAPTDEPEQPVKRLQLDPSNVSSASTQNHSISCSLPPHASVTFPTFEAYEIHYEQHHLHRCTECHKNFPSNHYLQLHISENHDPIIAVKRERGERTVGFAS